MTNDTRELPAKVIDRESQMFWNHYGPREEPIYWWRTTRLWRFNIFYEKRSFTVSITNL